jgi:hypothetical protein
VCATEEQVVERAPDLLAVAALEDVGVVSRVTFESAWPIWAMT